jgi:pyridinium-3,5-biscarboxylic acid mononucleotide synthase
VNHDIDGQIELINQLLGDGLFGQKPRQEGKTEQEAGPKYAQSETQNTQQQANQQQTSSIIQTHPDTGRERRKGTPEVILGENKETSQIIAMAQGLLTGTGRAIISRLQPEAVIPIQLAFQECNVRIREAARAMVIYSPAYTKVLTGGHVGVISAGTSDIPVAEEAALIAEEMGCRVTCIYDVGVAGLHRLLRPLRDILAENVDVIIVVAGMDGALPSVVAGLVPVPVIGLPTSIGYGLGGKGVAALLSMLQTCAPGMSVVNIDNGVGAGMTAALIANRIAHAREHQSQ